MGISTRMFEMDQIDRDIIALLKRDGRMSNREAARALNISEGTVRNRLRRLMDEKVVQLAAVVGAAASGLAASAFVRMSVEGAKARQIATEAAAFEEVSFVGLTAGRFNVLVLVSVRDRQALVTFVHSKLGLLSGVKTLDTREIVRTFKHRFDRVKIS